MRQADTDKQQLLAQLNGILPGCVFELIDDDHLQFYGQGFALPWFTCVARNDVSVQPGGDRYRIRLTERHIENIRAQFFSSQFALDLTMLAQLDYLKINAECYDIRFEQLFGQYVYDECICTHIVRPRIERLIWLLQHQIEQVAMVLPRLFYFLIRTIYFFPLNQNWNTEQRQVYQELLALVKAFRKSALFLNMSESDRLLFNRVEAQLYLLEIVFREATDACTASQEVIKIACHVRQAATLEGNFSSLVALLCNAQYEIHKNICIDLIADLAVVIESFKVVEIAYSKELVACDFIFLVEVLMSVYMKSDVLNASTQVRIMPALIRYFRALPELVLSLHEKGIEVLCVSQKILTLLLATPIYQPGDDAYDDDLVRLVQVLCQDHYITTSLKHQISLGYTLQFENANFLHMLMATVSYDLVEKILPVLYSNNAIYALIIQTVRSVTEDHQTEDASFAVFLELLLDRYPVDAALCVASLLQVLMLSEVYHPKLIEILTHLIARQKITQNMVSGARDGLAEMAVYDGKAELVALLMRAVRFDDERLVDLLKAATESQHDRMAIAQMVFEALVRNLNPMPDVQLDMSRDLVVYLHEHYQTEWPFSHYVHAKTRKLMTAEMLLAHPEIQKLQAIHIKVTVDIATCCYLLVCYDHKQSQQITIKEQNQPVAYTPRADDIKAMLLQCYGDAVEHQQHVSIPFRSILYSRYNNDALLPLVYQQTFDYQQLERVHSHLRLLLKSVGDIEINEAISLGYRKRLKSSKAWLNIKLTDALERSRNINGAEVNLLASQVEALQCCYTKAFEQARTASKRQQDNARRCLEGLKQRLNEIRSEDCQLNKQQLGTVSAAQKLVRQLAKSEVISVEWIKALEQKNREVADIQRALLRRRQNKQRAQVAKAMLSQQQKQRVFSARRRTKSEEVVTVTSPQEARSRRAFSDPEAVPVAKMIQPLIVAVQQDQVESTLLASALPMRADIADVVPCVPGMRVDAPNFMPARSTYDRTLFGSNLNVDSHEVNRLNMNSPEFDVVRSVLLAL